MIENSVQQTLSRFAPILIFISITLIISGALVLLYFGYTVYHLIQSPDKSELLNYILPHLPEPPSGEVNFKIVDKGQTSELIIPSFIFGYVRFIFAFMIWAILGGLAGVLIKSGVNILQALSNKPVIKKEKTAEYISE